MNTTQETSDGPALMAAAAAEAARVVDGSTSAPLDTATPCTDWDLRVLLNHTILWTAYSAERRAYGESAAEDGSVLICVIAVRAPLLASATTSSSLFGTNCIPP